MKLHATFRITIFTAFLLCSIPNLYAQKKEPVLAKAYYSFSHIPDTLNLNYAVTDNMVLLLGKTSTIYRSIDRMKSDSTILAKFKSKATGAGSPVANNGSHTVLYLENDTHKAFQQDFLVNKYIYPIEYPTIEWHIAPDTATIKGQLCQKATGDWKGRTYIVWFCKDIPFRAGPWKLNGLPGLILQAYDTKKQVEFQLVAYESNVNPPVVIDHDPGLVVTTKPEYLKMRELFLSNPTAYIKASMPGVTNIKLPAPYVRKPAPNNPLELVK
ncbi:GLPGLI family protein [Taibaiella koreensis]|uniref:GLPGLI family protein n=1 Tax=Taibaiella koreensis TaxID=1268548 RepID=UPI000E59EC57|nr:GLPGLI family protein [Taibaiella koreensis]